MALWKKLVLAIAGVLIGMPVLLYVTWRAGIWADNSSYAKRVFYDVVHYDSVLGSRRWIDTGFGCAYAIVQLSDEAAAAPPAPTPPKPGKRHDPLDSFGGDWQPTPGPDLGDPRGDGPWLTCRIALGAELYAQLRAAVNTPGGWWTGRGGEIEVYSPAMKLAFKLSEGD